DPHVQRNAERQRIRPQHVLDELVRGFLIEPAGFERCCHLVDRDSRRLGNELASPADGDLVETGEAGIAVRHGVASFLSAFCHGRGAACTPFAPIERESGKNPHFWAALSTSGPGGSVDMWSTTSPPPAPDGRTTECVAVARPKAWTSSVTIGAPARSPSSPRSPSC